MSPFYYYSGQELLADAHFTIARIVEGRVNLGGWLQTDMVYLPTCQSSIPVLTGPGVDHIGADF